MSFLHFFLGGGVLNSLRSIFRRWAKLPILLIFYFPPLDSATYDHSLPALPLDLHHIPLLHTAMKESAKGRFFENQFKGHVVQPSQRLLFTVIPEHPV